MTTSRLIRVVYRPHFTPSTAPSQWMTRLGGGSAATATFRSIQPLACTGRAMRTHPRMWFWGASSLGMRIGSPARRLVWRVGESLADGLCPPPLVLGDGAVDGADLS